MQLQPGLLPGPRLCAICPSVCVLTEPGAYRERAPQGWPQWRHQGGTRSTCRQTSLSSRTNTDIPEISIGTFASLLV